MSTRHAHTATHWVTEAQACTPYASMHHVPCHACDGIRTTQHALNYHKPRTVWAVCSAEVLALWRSNLCPPVKSTAMCGGIS